MPVPFYNLLIILNGGEVSGHTGSQESLIRILRQAEADGFADAPAYLAPTLPRGSKNLAVEVATLRRMLEILHPDILAKTWK